MTLLESDISNQDEGEVHSEVTVLRSVVPDQDEVGVHCEVTILRGGNAWPGGCWTSCN